MIKLCVSGACGKMGRRIIALAKQDAQFDVAWGLEYPAHPQIGAGVDGVPITDDPAVIKDCDCVIEFSAPGAVIEHIPYAIKGNTALVVGTTGIEDSHQLIIREAAKKIPVVFSPNMSVGVNIFFKIIKQAAAALAPYGYTVSMQEAHHAHKKDAPSGTAKRLAAVVRSEKFTIDDNAIQSIRQGEIIGDHKVVFSSPVDSIELFHHAITRDMFAAGSISAARWLIGKKCGMYSMDEVLFKAGG